jgi:hypothetical protein
VHVNDHGHVDADKKERSEAYVRNAHYQKSSPVPGVSVGVNVDVHVLVVVIGFYFGCGFARAVVLGVCGECMSRSSAFICGHILYGLAQCRAGIGA